MRPACFFCVFSFIWLAECTPPTCYSRMLELSKEIMQLLEKLHNYTRAKTCVEVLPKMFIDVHNSCITTKLRDFLYILLNHPTQSCQERPRIVLLKLKVTNLYKIINKICHRELVFLTDDCEALETGQSTPRYGEDRLQLLVEEKR
uniref:Cytokine-like protein 1 n=1 Tax=Esox lucius TaxID=8010 RepID=C1BYY7_ESOLU|nr:Cytokine-like protein 1 precursor [Esox lucius]